MEPRQLGIIGLAACAAFGAAFGLSKATSSGDGDAGTTPAAQPQSFELRSAPGVGSVTTGAAPDLRIRPPRATPTPEPEDGDGPRPTSTPGPVITAAPTAAPTRTARPQPTIEPESGGGED